MQGLMAALNLLNTPMLCLSIVFVSFVDGPDSVQLNSSSPLTILEGDHVAVECEANCYPACNITWSFKSQIQSTSSVLSLNNIQRSSAGDYTCTAVSTDTQKSLDKIIIIDIQCK